ncbi:MAG: galactose mutarotase [Flavobacteriales bacterium]|nr:galactose mutarotase [Flavobacteriales bacterium]
MLISKENFNKQLDNKQVDLFTLKNSNGFTAQITNYGARIVSVLAKDSQGNFDDVVLGYNNIDDYVNSEQKYMGATVGRYANRIGGAQFSINNQTYKVASNKGYNHLHGGIVGFNAKVWDANQISETKVELFYLSVDGEEGYPGNLTTVITFEVSEENELKISYSATTDKATAINLTNHSYFNLLGEGKGSINDHIMQINADGITEVVAGSIPTGKTRPVANTAFDFNEPTVIGNRINDEDDQLKIGNGYDQNYVINGTGMRCAAIVTEPITGRTLEVITDEPGMQFYGGNFPDAKTLGKRGDVYKFRSAFCLETQHFPDSPNQPNFSSTILDPSETYKSTCIYKFGIITND